MNKGKRKGMKTVQCRTGCGHTMEIDQDSVAGTCWRCVNKMMATGITTVADEKEIDEDREKFEDN